MSSSRQIRHRIVTVQGYGCSRALVDGIQDSLEEFRIREAAVSPFGRLVPGVYAFIERGDHSYWTRVGIAYRNRDGSLYQARSRHSLGPGDALHRCDVRGRLSVAWLRARTIRARMG